MPYEEQFNMDDGQESGPSPEPLNKNQKIAAAGLAVFAILIIVLWAAQLKNNIYGPFNSNSSSNGQLSTSEEDQTLALKNKDTDGDGLSDYDELNIYSTSPYLADSDSDGFNDKEEIDKNYDPNCPQGRTCSGLLENEASTDTGASASPDTGLQNLQNQSSALDNLLNQYNSSSGQNNSQTGATDGSGLSTDQLSALKNLDAAGLRELLIQAGMDESTLNKISDEDLMKSFQETMSGQ